MNSCSATVHCLWFGLLLTLCNERGQKAEIRTQCLLAHVRYPNDNNFRCVFSTFGYSVQMYFSFADFVINYILYLKVNLVLANPPYGKKMAVAVHFTKIPCEPNTANSHIDSHMFCQILPCTNTTVYARFESFRTFLCVFMSVLRVFVR